MLDCKVVDRYRTKDITNTNARWQHGKHWKCLLETRHSAWVAALALFLVSPDFPTRLQTKACQARSLCPACEARCSLPQEVEVKSGSITFVKGRRYYISQITRYETQTSSTAERFSKVKEWFKAFFQDIVWRQNDNRYTNEGRHSRYMLIYHTLPVDT